MDIIYHVPYYNFGFFDSSQKQNDWDKYILMLEKYDYEHDPRVILRKGVDSILNQVDMLAQGRKLLTLKIRRTKATKTATKIWWSLIMLSRAISEDIFNNFVSKIDHFLQ